MDSSNPSNIHILLAQPDDIERRAVQQALERQGWAVTAVPDGAEALAEFARGAYDVIIAAVTMPRRDGMEVLRQIKAYDPNAQVILLTDRLSVGSATLGLRDGAFAYLLQPIEDWRQLTHTVEQALELRALRKRDGQIGAAAASSEGAPSRPVQEMMQATRDREPLPDILHRLTESSARLFDAPHAAILISRATVGLELDAASSYDGADDAARDLMQQIGDAFAWKIANERRTLIDILSPGQYFIGTPLLIRDELLGLLIVYPLRDNTADPERIATFEALATQASIAMEMARLAEDNARLSIHDPLTNTLTRAAFLDLADREFRRSWRFEQPLTAIVLDVDGMNDINLRGGRAFGDQVLRHTAAACRTVIRAFDLISHYENDSFALLLPMTDEIGARGAAERLRVAVGNLAMADAAGPVNITASMGVATYPRPNCASVFDLFDLAAALQRSARGRGNHEVVFAIQ